MSAGRSATELAALLAELLHRSPDQGRRDCGGLVLAVSSRRCWTSRSAACWPIRRPEARQGSGVAVVVLPGRHRRRPADLLGFPDSKLARYKIPKSVVFTAALPRNAAGKVIKAQIGSISRPSPQTAPAN